MLCLRVQLLLLLTHVSSWSKGQYSTRKIVHTAIHTYILYNTQHMCVYLLYRSAIFVVQFGLSGNNVRTI